MAVVDKCVKREACRIGGGPLIDVLDLGEIYLNDFLAPGDAPPEKYPLTLCYNPESELVQLRHTVDPELMFRTYWYNSGTNEAMAEHLREVVLKTVGVHATVSAGDVVVDIGANDGTLLSYYSGEIYTVGFDPANIKRARRVNEFVNEFFTQAAYDRLDLPPAKVITSIAMFYDIEDPVAFAKEVYNILDDDGVWVLEMHYLPTMLERYEVDAICHEHLTYYSLGSLRRVLLKAGFEIADAELNDANGGSMLVFAKKAAGLRPSGTVIEILEEEKKIPLIDRLMDFARGVTSNRAALRVTLGVSAKAGLKIIGYGASTKGNTLLQYCGIGPDLIPYIAERNPAKWGRKAVGSNIPIISEAEARAMNPDYFLALPYHFIDAFKKREAAFLARGGRFIVPVPNPQVVG